MGLYLIDNYEPKMSLPIYPVITFPERQDWTVGDSYQIKVEDVDRSLERVDDKPFNPLHEAVLLSEEVKELRSVNPILLALDANTSVKSKAIERISPSDKKYSPEKEVSVLLFLRKDATIDFVEDQYEGIGERFDKEDLEQ